MALELVGGPFMSAIFNVLLDRLASSEIADSFKKNSSEKLLKRLKITLLSVNAVLNDAEEKQVRNSAVKDWLDELKDVALDADDLLDEITTNLKSNANEVKTLESASFKFFDRIEVERKLEDVLERLEFIIKQKEALDLRADRAAKIAQKTPTSSVIEACDVYGRDNDKDVLVNLLLLHDADGENVGVVPIVGMGGAGKTTLAQIVYNDDRIQKEFDLKAWIYVSEEFDICKITKSLLETITCCSCDIEDLNSLQRNLKSLLMKKKFMFVFDDVWNENYDNWDKFSSPFKHAAQGSKIIVTTRSSYVASIMQTVPAYNLCELSNEDSWRLFAKHAFGYRDSNINLGVEKVGKDIVRKCKGLPLAVKTLAGLLRAKSDKQEWLKVLGSEIWDLQDHESNILPALRLSYHYLPAHLKRCFAYCSIFPKDYEFEKETLTLLWMAEGLLQQSKRHKRIEEAGYEYFVELASRSFFQQSRRDKACFVMHHLVNDLAKFASGDFSFRLEDNNSNRIGERTRHLSHIVADGSSQINMNDVCKANRLRTFLQIQLFSTSIDLLNNMPNDMLMKLRRLRVLTLVGVYLYNLPDSIGELKHLRYLEVSDSKIITLPKSVCSLYNLQTLKLIGCFSLVELPKRLHDLVNLRYLDITGTCLKWMPLHMGKLRNLQKLSDFFLGNQCRSVIGELGGLSDLHGSLFIHGLEHIADHKESEKAKLREKSCLDKLSLDWCGNGDTDDSQLEKKILASLQPNTNLKELIIHGYPGTEFPKWLGDKTFFNLGSLQLKGCKYCCKLPALGQIPSLKELRISRFDGLVSIGSEFFGNETQYSVVTKSFPALEILKFEHMSAWEKWDHDADTGCNTFNQLRELHIQSCSKLTGDLPCNLPSLKLLTITDCNQLLCSLPTAPDLRVLNIQNCGNLEFPVPGPHCYQLLTSMYLLDSFDSLKCLPLDLSPNLKSLDIWGCKNLEALMVSESNAASPSNLPSLRSLSIRHCPKLESFTKGAVAAPKLTLLTINFCEKLKSLPNQMHRLMPSLKEVQLRGCPQMESSDMRPLRIRICDKLREEKQNLSDPVFASFKGLSPICSPSSR